MSQPKTTISARAARALSGRVQSLARDVDRDLLGLADASSRACGAELAPFVQELERARHAFSKAADELVRALALGTPPPPLPPRVLLAEDEAGLRRLLSTQLRRSGYQVVEAADGVEALERFEAGGVDLLLSDVRMPGLSGVEVVQRVRARAGDLPVVLMSADPFVAPAGCRFLAKPLSLTLLLSTVEQALREAPASRERREPRAGAPPAEEAG